MMKKDVVILVAEDEESHLKLIRKNLERSGITNDILEFRDGQEILDFLFQEGKGTKRKNGSPYLLLLDIRMPRVDGTEVLKRLKADPELKKMPVIMLTTTDDPLEVERCHALGCSAYVAKPVDYDQFVEAIRRVGLFLAVVQVPRLNGEK